MTAEHHAKTRLGDLIRYLDNVLEPRNFRDWGKNGLQVPGASGGVTRVATGVSPHATFLSRAREAGAELALTHHNISFDLTVGVIDDVVKRRLQILFDADMALASYHLPLDGHPEHGNNALLAKAIGAAETSGFGDHHGANIGVAATLPEPIPVAELLGRVQGACGGREPLLQGAGPDAVRTVGIVSGAAADSIHEAIADGLDAFITGEPAEWAMGRAIDAGIHFIAAGHYATETHGVRRLGELLHSEFGIEPVFIDVPNPV